MDYQIRSLKLLNSVNFINFSKPTKPVCTLKDSRKLLRIQRTTDGRTSMKHVNTENENTISCLLQALCLSHDFLWDAAIEMKRLKTTLSFDCRKEN